MNPSPVRTPFLSAHKRARIVKILLVLGIIVTGLGILVEVTSLGFPLLTDEQEVGDNPVGTALVLILFLFAIPDIVIYISTVVFFLMWLYRASNNLRAFNPWTRLEYTASWAIGGFFIPFANLIVPYRAIREVWQKSATPDESLGDPSPPAFFTIWWVFWLLASFAGNISMRIAFDESVPMQNATIISIVTSALSIIAAIFCYFVVDDIDTRQEETSRKLQLEQFMTPPPPPADMAMQEVVTPASDPVNSPQS